MSKTRGTKIEVRRNGGYFHLAPGPALASLPVYERRLARVERCVAALKAASKEGDMARIREIKAHLAWAKERLDGTADRNVRKVRARRYRSA